MSSRPLLSSGSEAEEIVRLRREIVGLERELEEAKDETTKAKAASSDAIHVIRALRNSPLKQVYDVLRMVFGEISRVEVESISTSENSSGTSPVIWAERIAKVGSAQKRVLQVLLDGGGPMSVSQVRNAAGTGGNTSTYLNQLQARNWVQKVAHGSWALK